MTASTPGFRERMTASTPGSREHMTASPRPARVEASPAQQRKAVASHLVEARSVGVRPERDAAAQLPLAVFTQQPEADETQRASATRTYARAALA
jgi:hypothetical protein